MKVKSYYAKSIESAMASAGHEMGPEAILITSRRTSGETRELGEYEVVFGLMTEAEPSEPPPSRVKAEPQITEMEAVRRELAGMRRTLASVCRTGANDRSMPELSYAEALLAEADFAPDLREELTYCLKRPPAAGNALQPGESRFHR